MLRRAQGVRGARRWQLGAGRAGALQARGARGRSDRRARGRRMLGRGAAATRRAAGHAGNGRQAREQARRGRAGERGWAHGPRGARPAWAWPGRWMGAQAGLAGPVLVHCAPGSVLARFLNPVRLGIFLSHQMNTVRCKINFRKKKLFIKFK